MGISMDASMDHPNAYWIRPLIFQPSNPTIKESIASHILFYVLMVFWSAWIITFSRLVLSATWHGGVCVLMVLPLSISSCVLDSLWTSGIITFNFAGDICDVTKVGWQYFEQSTCWPNIQYVRATKQPWSFPTWHVMIPRLIMWSNQWNVISI